MMCGPKHPTRCYSPVVECTTSVTLLVRLLEPLVPPSSAPPAVVRLATVCFAAFILAFAMNSIDPTDWQSDNEWSRTYCTSTISHLNHPNYRHSTFYNLEYNANYRCMQECIVLVVGSRSVTLLSNGSLWCKYMPCTFVQSTVQWYPANRNTDNSGPACNIPILAWGKRDVT